MESATLFLARRLVFAATVIFSSLQLANAATVNVALNKTAYQSSTLGGAVASRAVDSNIEGQWRGGSLSHTLADAEPWLEIDLEDSYEIESIALWNRTDCCRERLSDYYVFIKNTPFTSNQISEIKNESGVTHFHQTSAPAPKAYIDVNKALGRYVRVQKQGKEALHIAELEVFADDKQGAQQSRAVNVALNKPATQSSVYATASADRAVDGHTQGDWSQQSVAHTLAEPQPWLEIDLQANYDIGSIKVWNRTDCCMERLSDYYVFVKETPFVGSAIDDLSTEIGVSSFHQTSAPSPSETITTNNIVGRYIRLQRVGQGVLNVAEVEVISDRAPIPARPALANLYNHLIPHNMKANAQGLPILHSLPSAETQIYLDFDGHGDKTAFDLDQDPTSFNYEEQTFIYNWWLSTAAHFSMFDVNVTTELDPAKAHSWSLISPSISGAVAYGRVGFRNSPITSVSSGFGPYSTVIGHEGGHTFALPHVIGLDSQGEVNSGYYHSPYPLRGWHLGTGDLIVNKWSNKFHGGIADQYFGEIEKVVEYLQGFDANSSGFRVDDHRSEFGRASALTRHINGYFSQHGVIETMDDHDMFYIDWPGGTALIHAGSVELSPVNLDIALYDSKENLITTYRNGENHQIFSAELDAGRYYINLTSAGRYSDLGQYQVSLTPVPKGFQMTNLGPKRSIAPVMYDAAQNQWTLKSTGGDIWGTEDNAVFIHKNIQGNAEIVARIDMVSNTNGWAKTGVSFRAGLTRGAAHVSLLHSPVHGLGVFVRGADGGSTGFRFGASINGANWVKLKKTKQSNTTDLFVAYISQDGQSWQSIGQLTLSGLPAVMHTGIIQSAKNRYVAMTSKVSQVTINSTEISHVDDALKSPENVVIKEFTHDKAKIGWDRTANNSSYVIERSEDGFNFQQIATVDDLEFSDLGLQPAHFYYYRVRALAGQKYSQASNKVSVELRAGPVLDLDVIASGENGMLLDWGEPLGQRGYKIERSENGVDFYLLTDHHADFATNLASDSFANTQKYVDANLQSGTSYYYRVTTLDKLGSSQFSVAMGTTRLATPSEIRVSNRSQNEIELQWDSINNATQYKLEYFDQGQWRALAVLDANITSYRHTGLSHTSAYKYRLQAVSGQTTSASKTMTIATQAENPPVAPWQHEQVDSQMGVVNQDGSADFTFASKTKDIWSRNDSFQFLSQPITGDFDAKVKVDQLDMTSIWAKAGLMVRDGVATNAMHISALLGGNQGAAMQWRGAANGTTAHRGQTGDKLQAPAWLRLQRVGNRFTAYYSDDGLTWSQLHSIDVALPQSVKLGLFHASNNNKTEYGIAKFKQLRID